MKNPKEELRKYLERLIHRYLNIVSLHRELKSILEWKSPQKIEALNLGSYFFRLTVYSLSRTVLVELSMLVSDSEQRSLLDWLKKAKEHAKSVEPTRYNPRHARERELIKPKEYRAIIENHLATLNAHQHVIGRIKARRDKAIAHLDKEYFDKPRAIYKDYPLSDDDIEGLMSIISDILRRHHSCLFEADLQMEIVSGRRVDVILRYARAFQRARKDRNLINKGFRPIDYLRDSSEEIEF